jgi:hypothetical protein
MPCFEKGSSPIKTTDPEEGLSSRAEILQSVVFPEPDLPLIKTKPPDPSEKLNPRST